MTRVAFQVNARCATLSDATEVSNTRDTRLSLGRFDASLKIDVT